MAFEDILKVEGLELSDEQKQALMANAKKEFDAETAGLKQSRDALLEEKKSEAQKAKDAIEAQKAAELEAAKKAGDIDKIKQIEAQRADEAISAYKEKLEAYQSRELSSSTDSMIEKIMAHSVDPNDEVFRDSLRSRIQSTRDAEGNISTVLRNREGEIVATDLDGALGFARKDASYSKFIKASDASGGGANGSNGNGGANTGKTSARDQRVAAINARMGVSN